MFDEEIEDLAKVVRMLLKRQTMVRIIVQLTGVCSYDWYRVMQVLQHVQDPRLYAGKDPRCYLNWDEEERLRAHDIRRGVDIWSRGVQICPE